MLNRLTTAITKSPCFTRMVQPQWQLDYHISLQLCWLKGWPWQPCQSTAIHSQLLVNSVAANALSRQLNRTAVMVEGLHTVQQTCTENFYSAKLCIKCINKQKGTGVASAVSSSPVSYTDRFWHLRYVVPGIRHVFTNTESPPFTKGKMHFVIN